MWPSSHSKMAESETRYTHQLETMAAQLQATNVELQRHKEALSNTEELLQRQQQSMMSQLQQKEEELQTSYRDNKQLHVSEKERIVHVCMCCIYLHILTTTHHLPS